MEKTEQDADKERQGHKAPNDDDDNGNDKENNNNNNAAKEEIVLHDIANRQI